MTEIRPGDGARLGDPAGSPLKTRGGSGRPQAAVFESTASRWSARGRVVPITGIRRSQSVGIITVGQPHRDAGEDAAFEAIVEWHGPPLPEFGRQPGRRPVEAQTGTVVDDPELGRRIVIAALELIDRGEVPFPDSIRDAMRHRPSGEGWLDRYRQLVGDDGLAAAEGY